MSGPMEILNVPVVSKALEDKGLKRIWVMKQLGMNRHSGYVMFRNGVLPADDTCRKQIVSKLANITGLPVTQLLVRLPAAVEIPA